MVVAIAIGYVHPLRSYLAARADVSERRVEVGRLESANAALKRRLERVGTSEFVEREARRLGLVKPGERLFIVTGVEDWLRARAAKRASLR